MGTNEAFLALVKQSRQALRLANLAPFALPGAFPRERGKRARESNCYNKVPIARLFSYLITFLIIDVLLMDQLQVISAVPNSDGTARFLQESSCIAFPSALLYTYFSIVSRYKFGMQHFSCCRWDGSQERRYPVDAAGKRSIATLLQCSGALTKETLIMVTFTPFVSLPVAPGFFGLDADYFL